MTKIGELRCKFHKSLIDTGLLSLSEAKNGELIASNADSSQKLSKELARRVAFKIADTLDLRFDLNVKKMAGQTSGNLFEECCGTFISEAFRYIEHLRPGKWIVEKINSRGKDLIGRFDQYSHLAELSKLASEHQTLKNFLGDGYTVAPDVAILREPEPDEIINRDFELIGDCEATYTALRKCNHIRINGEVKTLLHASVSCKYTMRSDRAQNTRTEALNLIRGRKGRVPHIVAITAEPIPSRIASLAQGTGDIDCVYHFALHELVEAMVDYVTENDIASDYLSQLQSMIDGKRLKDISDLPFDLAI